MTAQEGERAVSLALPPRKRGKNNVEMTVEKTPTQSPNPEVSRI